MGFTEVDAKALARGLSGKELKEILEKRAFHNELAYFFDEPLEGYMGGRGIDFTGIYENYEQELDPRFEHILDQFHKLLQGHPHILLSLRNIVEPGSGSGSMTLRLYNFFRKEIFPNGFPEDFRHLGIEKRSTPDDWYQQQSELEKADWPNLKRQFARHYQLQKSTDFVAFAQDPLNHGRFDAVMAISIYDLIAVENQGVDLFSLTRKILKPGGIFLLAYTEPKFISDNPQGAGFELISTIDPWNLMISVWQAK